MAFRPTQPRGSQAPLPMAPTRQSRLINAQSPSPSSSAHPPHSISPYAYISSNPGYLPIFEHAQPPSSSPLYNINIQQMPMPTGNLFIPPIRRANQTYPTQSGSQQPTPNETYMAPRFTTSSVGYSYPHKQPSAAPQQPSDASGSFAGPSTRIYNQQRSSNAGPVNATGPRRKRPRIDDDDESEEPISAGTNGDGEDLVANKACTLCNRSKVKCRYTPGSFTCIRCKKKGLECQAREVRLSPQASRKAYVEAQLREKDAIIESLLRELHDPYRAHPLSVRTMEETSPPMSYHNPDTQEWRKRLMDDANKEKIGIFSFHLPTDTTTQDTSPTYSTDNTPPTGESPKGDGPLDDAAPIDMFTRMSLESRADVDAEEKSDSSASSTAADEHSGPANIAYFEPGPGVDLRLRSRMQLEYRTSPLINHKLMTADDVDELFKLFHSKLGSFVPLLDPTIHTPQNTYARCPSLFSVVCAVASRYHKKKRHVYPIVMHIARNEAATAVMNGWKSIELAQAFILLALWGPPAKRWEEERGYLYTGIATRIAIDLNAHRCSAEPPKNAEEDREELNKRRLWMICFETDWAMAAHYGKPAAVKENQIIRISDDFYDSSSLGNNLMGDIGLSAYNRLLRLVADFHTEVYSNPDSRTGLRRDLDFPTKVEEYTTKLDGLQQEWTKKFNAYTDFQDDPAYKLRCDLLPYAISYKRLLMQSFEFQQAVERGMQPQDRAIALRCISSATQVLEIFVQKLVPGGFMLYAPNGWINYVAFAAAFLAKLLRPQHSNIISHEERQRIDELIRRLMDTLHSPLVAVDDRHTPKLWARFFEQLLAKLDRTPTMQASPTDFASSSSPEEWYGSGPAQPVSNITTDGNYYCDPNPQYEQWVQMGGDNHWPFSQQQPHQYQSITNFNPNLLGSDTSGHHYAPINPNSMGYNNVMMPWYHWY